MGLQQGLESPTTKQKFTNGVSQPNDGMSE